MNLVILGLILDIVGVFIITLTTIINPWHGRREDLKEKAQKLDKNILCFLLVHNYFAHHPSINQVRWYRQIPYIIFNGEADLDLLKKVIFNKSTIIKK